MLTQLRSKHFSFVQSEGATDRPKEGAAGEKNTKNEGTKRQPRHLQSVPKTADDKHKTQNKSYKTWRSHLRTQFNL